MLLLIAVAAIAFGSQIRFSIPLETKFQNILILFGSLMALARGIEFFANEYDRQTVQLLKRLPSSQRSILIVKFALGLIIIWSAWRFHYLACRVIGAATLNRGYAVLSDPVPAFAMPVLVAVWVHLIAVLLSVKCRNALMGWAPCIAVGLSAADRRARTGLPFPCFVRHSGRE